MKVNSKLCGYNNYADIVTSSPKIGSLMGWPFLCLGRESSGSTEDL